MPACGTNGVEYSSFCLLQVCSYNAPHRAAPVTTLPINFPPNDSFLCLFGAAFPIVWSIFSRRLASVLASISQVARCRRGVDVELKHLGKCRGALTAGGDEVDDDNDISIDNFGDKCPESCEYLYR